MAKTSRYLTFTFLLLGLIIKHASHAQNPVVIDSLLSLLESERHAAEQFDIYLALAKEYQDSDSLETVKYASLAKQAAIENKYPEGEIESMVPLAELARDLGNYADAEKITDEIIRRSDSIGFLPGSARAKKIMGSLSWHQGNNQEALKYYEAALVLFREIGDERSAASTLNGLGIIYSKMGSYKRGQEYYFRALRFYERLGNKRAVAKLSNNIGVLYKIQNDFDKALEYYEKSLRINEESKDKNGIAYSLINIGALLYTKGDWVESIPYFNRSIALREEIGDKQGIADCILNRGEAHAALGKLELAVSEFNQALKTYENLGDKEGLSYAYSNLADAYNKMGASRKARDYLKKSLDLAEVMNAGLTKAIATEALAEVEYGLGNYRQAYLLMDEAKGLFDSLKNETTLSKIASLEAKYEFEKREEQLKADQEKEALTLQNSIAKERFRGVIFIVMAAAIFIVFVGSLMFYFELRKKNKILLKSNEEIASKNKTIQRQKDQLTQALQDKDLILKEINHRTKNNLLLLENLLFSQLKETDDPNIRTALEINRNRFEAIALVHQTLSINDTLESISLPDYLTKLSTKSLEVLAGTESIEFAAEIEDISLQAHIIVPIGLIVNEVITNAVKHAFTEDQKGRISLQALYKQQSLVISVQDNGRGIDSEMSKSNSFGLIMIEGLSKQLEANYQFLNDSGTNFTLSIPLSKLIDLPKGLT